MTQVAHRPAPAPRTGERGDAGTGRSRTPSFFFNGHAPRRRALVLLAGALFGFALTVIWSAQFVDKTIGDNIADTLLGYWDVRMLSRQDLIWYPMAPWAA
ncbi:hypothetical protein [Streptomyces sp. H34-S4]|uniref:hypothetical protein n=1 Tax=Streptomyces sp. H34-S4 TaxID=2996463 RepID=UPI00227091BA|nr:hypothetical protein [Streptomyces sp. H34-S4]MCY0937630.1 hypothetical protein [Streptomyces sp. H34-S4]